LRFRIKLDLFTDYVQTVRYACAARV